MYHVNTFIVLLCVNKEIVIIRVISLTLWNRHKFSTIITKSKDIVEIR